MRVMYLRNRSILAELDEILKSRGKIVDATLVEAFADAIRKLNLDLNPLDAFGGRYTETIRQAIVLSKEAT